MAVENDDEDIEHEALWWVPGRVRSKRVRSGTADIQLARLRMVTE
jgi:hypothetical protein